MSINPCKGCEDRHYLCHSTCEKYIAWKQEHDELKAKIKAEKNLNHSLWCSSRHSYTKDRRRRPYADNRS